MADRTFSALVRKLHAAELLHLREVVAEQQAQIEAQAQRIHDLEREASWADDRADMFQALATELRDAHPGVRVGLSQDGHLGVLQ